MQQQRTRVKICGITRSADAGAVADAGVDAVGLVFHPASPRYVDAVQAARLVRELPPFVTVTGLFMDAAVDVVREVLASVPLDLLQFHGSESAQYCGSFGRPYIKAVPMGGNGNGYDESFAAAYPDARGFLVDSHAPGQPGGSGHSFDWAALTKRPSRPLILAGGLRPENVATAVRQVRPWAVDVSSGVESAPGHKDAALINQFVEEVRSGDRR